MTIGIVISAALGIFSGYAFLPDRFISATGWLLVIGLSIVLFFVGVDLGRDGTVVKNLKSAGWRVFAFPVAIAMGSFAGCMVGSLFLPISCIDSALVASGMGWYSLAPVIITPYSEEIAAISFMHNVLREMLSIVLVPFVAKYIGYLECIALPGSTGMDICLPVVEKVTSPSIVVYSFVAGVVLSLAVPIITPLLVTLAQSMI